MTQQILNLKTKQKNQLYPLIRQQLPPPTARHIQRGGPEKREKPERSEKKSKEAEERKARARKEEPQLEGKERTKTKLKLSTKCCCDEKRTFFWLTEKTFLRQKKSRNVKIRRCLWKTTLLTRYLPLRLLNCVLILVTNQPLLGTAWGDLNNTLPTNALPLELAPSYFGLKSAVSPKTSREKRKIFKILTIVLVKRWWCAHGTVGK